MILLNCNIINDTSFSTSTFTWDADGQLRDVMRPCLGDTSARAIWLSLDPLLDKYPEISPYAYCANNPIKYIDPDGKRIIVGSWFGRAFAKLGFNNYEAKVQSHLQELKDMDPEINKMITKIKT